MEHSKFTDFMSNKLANEVAMLIMCNNPCYDKMKKSKDGFYEGTIRAAVWSVLRTNLPDSWFIQAECGYPEENIQDYADIIVWSPENIPFIIEVKPFVGIDAIEIDINKLRRYIKRNINKEIHAYMIYLTIYGYWKLADLYPNKDWKTCDFCIKQREVGKAMPFGYGDCKNCEFSIKTIQYLKNNNIEVVPIYIPAF